MMKNLLNAAKHEILALRKRNEILEAKAQVIDAFTMALNCPRPSQGFSTDIAWSLQKAIEEIENAAANPVPQPEEVNNENAD